MDWSLPNKGKKPTTNYKEDEVLVNSFTSRSELLTANHAHQRRNLASVVLLRCMKSQESTNELCYPPCPKIMGQLYGFTGPLRFS